MTGVHPCGGHGNISTLLALCEGNPLVSSGSPNKESVMYGFHVFFDVPPNKWLKKQ